MSGHKVENDHFMLALPDGNWTDQTSAETFDFRRGDDEQVIVVVHLARQRLGPQQLVDGVSELLQSRLNAVQTQSGNACQFESPEVKQTFPNCLVRVVGHDMRNQVRIGIGIFGTPAKVVIVSHYDYTGVTSAEGFKQRSGELFDSYRIAK